MTLDNLAVIGRLLFDSVMTVACVGVVLVAVAAYVRRRWSRK